MSYIALLKKLDQAQRDAEEEAEKYKSLAMTYRREIDTRERDFREGVVDGFKRAIRIVQRIDED